MSIHLLNPTGDALTSCGSMAARRAELTMKLAERTCDDCRTALIRKGICPVCGKKKLSWGTSPINNSSAANGRLRVGDVETAFYLGCDNCSETVLAHVRPETIARVLTEMNWRP